MRPSRAHPLPQTHAACSTLPRDVSQPLEIPHQIDDILPVASPQSWTSLRRRVRESKSASDTYCRCQGQKRPLTNPKTSRSTASFQACSASRTPSHRSQAAAPTPLASRRPNRLRRVQTRRRRTPRRLPRVTTSRSLISGKMSELAGGMREPDSDAPSWPRRRRVPLRSQWDPTDDE